jgi:hypothetical protein
MMSLCYFPWQIQVENWQKMMHQLILIQELHVPMMRHCIDGEKIKFNPEKVMVLDKVYSDLRKHVVYG